MTQDIPGTRGFEIGNGLPDEISEGKSNMSLIDSSEVELSKSKIK